MIFTTPCILTPGGGSGAMPSGVGPFGAATATGHTIAGLEPITANQLRVYLRGIADVGSRYEPDTVLYPDSWAIEALDPDASTRLVQHVELVTPGVNPIVDIFTDGILTFRRQYRVTLLTASALTGCDAIDFASIEPQFSETTRGTQLLGDAFVDIANPNLRQDQVTLGALSLGTYVIDSAGDLKQDQNATGLRKRVIRRVTTALGGFFHLPDYGLAQGMKTLLRPDLAVRLAARARAQIVSEPDVRSAQVAVTNPQTAPSLLGLIIRVESTYGETLGLALSLSPTGEVRE